MAQTPHVSRKQYKISRGQCPGSFSKSSLKFPDISLTVCGVIVTFDMFHLPTSRTCKLSVINIAQRSSSFNRLEVCNVQVFSSGQ